MYLKVVKLRNKNLTWTFPIVTGNRGKIFSFTWFTAFSRRRIVTLAFPGSGATVTHFCTLTPGTPVAPISVSCKIRKELHFKFVFGGIKMFYVFVQFGNIRLKIIIIVIKSLNKKVLRHWKCLQMSLSLLS